MLLSRGRKELDMTESLKNRELKCLVAKKIKKNKKIKQLLQIQ